MLGEMVSELQGKVSSQRVIVKRGRKTMVETSEKMRGEFLGTKVKVVLTYLSDMRPNGVLYAYGNGIVMSEGGDGATFRAQGVGKLTGQNTVSIRGSVFYETASRKFDKLNYMATVFEYEMDEDENTVTKTWEWK
ncbi:MAG: hypothetical protein IBX40_01435 [Methanosarcinales archaeon]|nr:hypothetical protein [Methanosarcinales archaeon]